MSEITRANIIDWALTTFVKHFQVWNEARDKTLEVFTVAQMAELHSSFYQRTISEWPKRRSAVLLIEVSLLYSAKQDGTTDHHSSRMVFEVLNTLTAILYTDSCTRALEYINMNPEELEVWAKVSERVEATLLYGASIVQATGVLDINEHRSTEMLESLARFTDKKSTKELIKKIINLERTT